MLAELYDEESSRGNFENIKLRTKLILLTIIKAIKGTKNLLLSFTKTMMIEQHSSKKWEVLWGTFPEEMSQDSLKVERSSSSQPKQSRIKHPYS